MKKNNKIIINCTSEEKDKIKAQSKQADMKLQDYCLKILLNVVIELKMKAR